MRVFNKVLPMDQGNGTSRKSYRYHLTGLLVLFVSLLAGMSVAVAGTCQADVGMQPSKPDSSFTDHGNGTVTDNRTKLTWKKCSEGQTYSGGVCSGAAATFSWVEALDRGRNDTTATYNDWRLPNAKELRSLVEECNVDPAINDSLFPATPNSYFWSGSPYLYGDSISWAVGFSLGESRPAARSSNYHVRLVRAAEPTIAPPTPTYSLKVTANAPSVGSRVKVTSEPVGIDISLGLGKTASATTTFPVDTTVKLTAMPTAAVGFTGWGGACESANTALVCTLTLGENSEVVANFGNTIEAILIKGDSSVSAGGQIQLQASSVSGGKTQAINATWSLVGTASGVSLSSAGLLTVQSNATVGPVVVKAIYQNAASEFIVNIQAATAQSALVTNVETSGLRSSHSLSMQINTPQSITIDQFDLTSPVGFAQADATCKSKDATYRLAAWSEVTDYFTHNAGLTSLQDLQLDAWLKADGTTVDYYMSYHNQLLWAAYIDKLHTSGPQLNALCIKPATYDFYVAALTSTNEPQKMLNSSKQWVAVTSLSSLAPYQTNVPINQVLKIFDKANMTDFSKLGIWLAYVPSGTGLLTDKMVLKLVYQLP